MRAPQSRLLIEEGRNALKQMNQLDKDQLGPANVNRCQLLLTMEKRAGGGVSNC